MLVKLVYKSAFILVKTVYTGTTFSTGKFIEDLSDILKAFTTAIKLDYYVTDGGRLL